MQRTEHYNLSKPERMDPFRAQDIADNLDAIDEAIHNAAESGTASVDGMDIKPASVAATGAITGASVGDSNGTLQQLRDSVSRYVDVSVSVDSGPYPAELGWYYGNVTLPVTRNRILAVTLAGTPDNHPGSVLLLNTVIRVYSTHKGTATIRVAYK